MQAMATLEDELDVVAAKRVVSEASADQREFDERVPIGVVKAQGEGEEVDEQYLELLNQVNHMKYCEKLVTCSHIRREDRRKVLMIKE